MSISYLIASLAYICMILGIVYVRHRTLHLRWMCAAAVLDIGLVLALQISRDAVGIVMAGDLDLFGWIHVGSSTLAILLYIPNILLGFYSASPKLLHRRLGKLIFALRSIGFIFMFSMLD